MKNWKDLERSGSGIAEVLSQHLPASRGKPRKPVTRPGLEPSVFGTLVYSVIDTQSRSTPSIKCVCVHAQECVRARAPPVFLLTSKTSSWFSLILSWYLEHYFKLSLSAPIKHRENFWGETSSIPNEIRYTTHRIFIMKDMRNVQKINSERLPRWILLECVTV